MSMPSCAAAKVLDGARVLLLGHPARHVRDPLLEHLPCVDLAVLGRDTSVPSGLMAQHASSRWRRACSCIRRLRVA